MFLPGNINHVDNVQNLKDTILNLKSQIEDKACIIKLQGAALEAKDSEIAALREK